VHLLCSVYHGSVGHKGSSQCIAFSWMQTNSTPTWPEAVKGREAEKAPKSLDQALASRLMDKVLSTLGAMRKPHRKSSILTIILDHLPRHLSPTPHKLLGLLSRQSVVTALIQGNRLLKIVVGEF